jgi:outer membrane protein TolC
MHTFLVRHAAPARAARAPVAAAIVLAPLIASVLGGLHGCKSYEPRPLELERTQREFLLRTLDGPAIAEFSAQLAAAPHATTPFDASDGLSLAEAEAVTLVFNRELRAARLEAGVTRASAENGGLWQDPALGVDFTQIVSGASQGLEAIVSLGFTLPLSGRLELEKERLGAEHAAQLARVAEAEWRTVAELRRAWTERTAIAREVEATRDVLARVTQVLAVVGRMEAAGELARIEARLFRIEEAKLRAQLGAHESDLVRASHGIEALLGLPPAATRVFAEEFAASTKFGPESREAAIATLAETSPCVVVARAEYEAAERRLAEEVRRQWPDLSIAPGFGEQDGERQFVLGLGVVLPIFNGNRSGIAVAEASREAARGRAEAALEQALGALQSAEERLAAADSRRAILADTLVPLVEAQYEETRAVARLGEVKTLVLLESLQQQLEAKQALIAAHRDASLASIDIDELIGPTLPLVVEKETRQ